jgi:hypothetical protein
MHKVCVNDIYKHISLYTSIVLFWNCPWLRYTSTRKHIETRYVETLLPRAVSRDNRGSYHVSHVMSINRTIFRALECQLTDSTSVRATHREQGFRLKPLAWHMQVTGHWPPSFSPPASQSSLVLAIWSPSILWNYFIIDNVCCVCFVFIVHGSVSRGD